MQGGPVPHRRELWKRTASSPQEPPVPGQRGGCTGCQQREEPKLPAASSWDCSLGFGGHTRGGDLVSWCGPECRSALQALLSARSWCGGAFMGGKISHGVSVSMPEAGGADAQPLAVDTRSVLWLCILGGGQRLKSCLSHLPLPAAQNRVWGLLLQQLGSKP